MYTSILYSNLSFKAERHIGTVLPRYIPYMYFKTTINLLDVYLKMCFLKVYFHFNEAFLVVSGALAGSGGAHAPSKFQIYRPVAFYILYY